MNENQSALKNHFLTSILPHQQIKHPEHFLKTKQFYRPEQFIWNNPHRTSKRLYPYYHMGKDEYQTKIKPNIQKLQQQDRINLQQQRIKKLTNFRIQTRQKFFQKKFQRQQLQARSNSRNRQTSTIQVKTIPALKSSIYRSHSNSNHVVANIEQTYRRGVQLFDTNINHIRKLVGDQMEQNHKKIRIQFQKRRQHNEVLNNSIKIKGRKSVVVIQNDNFILT